jgi:hypothetical protein
MRKLTAEDRALLETLLQKANEADKIVWDAAWSKRAKEMIQKIGRRAKKRAADLELKEPMVQQESPLLIAFNSIGLQSDFKKDAPTSREELSKRLDIICTEIKGALKLFGGSA